MDIKKIREDFSILNQMINNYPLTYLDNAATTLKPKEVAENVYYYYMQLSSNIHRGVHTLSQKSTDLYEEARLKVKNFINAKEEAEIIFTKGTTNSINTVAQSFGTFINENDEIIISHLEHHSNIVPWQMLCEKKKCKLKVIPINLNGEIIFDEYLKLINEKTKLVSITYISNALGTINPVEEIIKEAHKNNIPVLIDGAQAISHIKVDVQKLDCDFFAFSSHKMFGPTGTGVLYGKRKYLDIMPPVEGGGDMIEYVSFAKTTYNVIPYKFEAGTPDIAGVIGLSKAIDYINATGIENIYNYEKELLEYATKKLSTIDDLKIIGTAKEKTSIISFTLKGIHPHDIGTLLDEKGVAIRTGHHCAQPVMQFFKIPATARASFAFYNTFEDVDRLYDAILHTIEVFK